MLPTDPARIARVRVTGPGDCRDRVRPLLDAAPWESVSDPREVILLRQVHAMGGLPELGMQSVEAAKALAARAVDGWDPGADRAPAVRFASRGELLACLVRDLLAGRADGRWFWRLVGGVTRLPAQEAVPRLLAAEALSLSAVFARLESEPEWPRLWHALGDHGAQQILAAVQRATGWPVAVAAVDAEDGAGAESNPVVGAFARPMDGWLGLAGVQDGADPAAPRLRLFLVARLWQLQPHLLKEAPRVVRALARAVCAEGRAGGSATTGAAEPPVSEIASRRPGEPPTGEGESVDEPASQRSSRHPVPRMSPEPPPVAGLDWELEVSPLGPESPGGPGDSSEEGAVTPAVVEPTAESVPHPREARLVTSRGGWYLLLNALARPVAQERLGREPAVPGHAVGWVWLYRLGRALGAQADPALARFLADRIGLEDPGDLETLGPLDVEADLVRLTRARYGEAALEAVEAELPALVVADASHLDVHYRLADARLAVRRAALDVNPGWLPWLGRVVTFHYGEHAGLAGWAPAEGPG